MTNFVSFAVSKALSEVKLNAFLLFYLAGASKHVALTCNHCKVPDEAKFSLT